MTPAGDHRSDASLTVLLVDDHQMLVDSLLWSLHAQGVTGVKPDLRSVDSVIAQAEQVRPDLILLDLDLGAALGTGESLVGPLVAQGHRVLVVSGTRDVVRFGACLQAGAVGAISKSIPLADLVSSILRAASGQQVIPDSERAELISRHLHRESRDAARRSLLERLSTREREVLLALSEGQSVGRIAANFVVSESTVRSQVRAILHKLGVNSQLEAVALAGRHGWFN